MKYIFDNYDRGSKLDYIDIAKHDTTTNGRVKSVITSKTQVQLNIIHKVDEYNKGVFENFYNSNKDNIIDFTYGGLIYAVNFNSNPVYTPLNGNMWKITIKFTGLA